MTGTMICLTVALLAGAAGGDFGQDRNGETRSMPADGTGGGGFSTASPDQLSTPTTFEERVAERRARKAAKKAAEEAAKKAAAETKQPEGTEGAQPKG
jgi:hypothetical protein